jgi:hypothetical protein
MKQIIFQNKDGKLLLINFFCDFRYWQYNGEASVYEVDSKFFMACEFGSSRGWKFITFV